MLARAIRKDEIEAYQNDGIVSLRGFFDDSWVARMREAVNWSMENPSEMAIEMAESRRKEGRFFFDTFVWRNNPICRNFVLGLSQITTI